jgi:glycerol-3-phosphate dehydrogenase (NAD(P)+)
MDHSALLDRARTKGVNPFVYWIVRALFQPFFHLYFRLSRVGREHVPQEGPVIFAANHRSFLDPFIIATLARRPIYFVAKKELFEKRLTAWFLNSLGAFPVDRGNGDGDAMATAREILERGDGVLIFPEGTRVRPGTLGSPRRGVGRLALETGAPVVPVAIIGTETIRRGWRIRPHKVRVRAGSALRFPKVDAPSPELATAVTERIWPCVSLQWEWLGGLPPIRRAAVIGAGSWGTAMAVALQRAGVEVDLGCRTADQAARLTAAGENDAHLPGVALPPGITIGRAADLDLTAHDLVVLAVPTRALPATIAAHGEHITARSGVLVLTKGLVGSDPTRPSSPSAYVAERCNARAVAALAGPGHAADTLRAGASLVAASEDRGFARQLAELLRASGLDVDTTTDIVGAELAGAAKTAAVLAASTAAAAGPNAAGAAAGKVLAEVDAYARARGARPETFAGLAGVGDLVATLVDTGSRDRRAGELLARGIPGAESGPQPGRTVESFDAVALLAAAITAEGLPALSLTALAAVVDGSAGADAWARGITTPSAKTTRRRAA